MAVSPLGKLKGSDVPGTTVEFNGTDEEGTMTTVPLRV
jgi:hypothetical protein